MSRGRAASRRSGVSLVEVLVILVCLTLALVMGARRVQQATHQGADRVGVAVRDLRPLAAGASPSAPSTVSAPARALPRQPVTQAHMQLVSSSRDHEPQYPGLPPLPGSPGGPPPGAVAVVLGGAALGCVAGGGLALAGVITSVAAPVTCAGGALIGGLAGIVGVVAAPAVGHALESVAHGIGGLFGGGDDGGEGGDGDDGAGKQVDEYVDGLEKKPTPSSSARDLYEREVAGDTNYRITGNGEKIWADGIDKSNKSAVEAKYIDNPDESPFIENSNFYADPKPWQQKLLNEVDDEFRRYGQVLNDPNVPLKELTVKVSDEGAVPFFDRLMTKYGIHGRIVVEEPNFWYTD